MSMVVVIFQYLTQVKINPLTMEDRAWQFYEHLSSPFRFQMQIAVRPRNVL